MAEMCGGKGYLVRTPEELETATEEGFKANVPVVVNIIIESGHAKKLVCRINLLVVIEAFMTKELTFKKEFAWQKSTQEKGQS